MTTHLLGAVSSPGCVTFALRKLAKEFSVKYPRASKFIETGFYVDDGLVSAPTIESAKELVKEPREICATGNLRLHMFISNEPWALEGLPAYERDEAMSDVELAAWYTLGIKWQILKDIFTFTACNLGKPQTRRGVLSTVFKF